MQAVTINYLAVLVSGIAGMIIGALWYGPLFGKALMKYIGKSEKELRKGFNPAKTYSLAFIGVMFSVFVLAYFISLTGASTIIGGFRVALTAWVGFTAATTIVTNLFEKGPYKLLFIDACYHLVVLLVARIVFI